MSSNKDDESKPEVLVTPREAEMMKGYHLTSDKDGNLMKVPSSHVKPSTAEAGSQVSISIEELCRIVQANNCSQMLASTPPSGLGNPGPLGLGGFALTTFTLSVFNTGVFLDPTLEGVVLPLALFYGGLAQFIAGLFEFKAPNTFGATAFCSYGAFWMSFAAYVEFVAPGLNASTAHQATGLFLFAWLIFTTYMFFASMRVSKVVCLLFFFLTITFLLLTIGALGVNAHCTKAGGWFGLITAFIAWYGSAAVSVNSTWGRTVMPVGVFSKEDSLLRSWTSFHRNKIIA